MAVPKLSAPVGLKPRQSEGKPVVNKSDDVLLVQKMLKANGYNVKETGSVDSGMLKAIGAYQKKARLDEDQVIDPGGQAFSGLSPKYEAFIKELEKTKYHEVNYKGKCQYVTEAEYKKIKAQIVRDAVQYGKIYRVSQNFYEKAHKDFTDTIDAKKGYFKAAATLVMVNASGIKYPDKALVTKSGSAVAALEKAASSSDLKGIEKAFKPIEDALDKTYNDLMRYYKELAGVSWKVGTTLKVTSTTGFAILGAMAAAPVAAATGASLAASGIAVGGGLAVLESGSKEFGKYLGGSGTTTYESVWNIAIDGAVGAATAGLGSKIKLSSGFADDVAGQVAQRASGLCKNLSKDAAKKMISQYLVSGAFEGAKETAVQAVKLLGETAKSGKTPGEKELKAAFADIMFKALSSGLLANVKGFEAKFAMKKNKYITETLVPAYIDKYGPKETLGKVQRAAIIKAVTSSSLETFAKGAYDQTISAMTGKEKPDALVKEAQKKLDADKKLEAELKKRVEKALKDQKIPA